MPKYLAPPSKQAGFTLIELMVTIAILAIISMIAAPSFTPLMERWRVRGAAEALQSTIYYARSEAIKRGGGVTITATGGDWAGGWVVAGGGSTLQQASALNKVTVTASKTTLHLDRWGMISDSAGGAAINLDLLLTPSGKNNNTVRLCAGKGGRIELKRDGSAC